MLVCYLRVSRVTGGRGGFGGGLDTMVKEEQNTKYYEVTRDSSGTVVKKEEVGGMFGLVMLLLTVAIGIALIPFVLGYKLLVNYVFA